MTELIIAVTCVGTIGLVLAVVLYLTSKKFAVHTDPRITQIAEILPKANCGGCGYPGCASFAQACVQVGNLEGRNCPVGGAAVMEKVAVVLGIRVSELQPRVAVVRCKGDCKVRSRNNQYDGIRTCATMSLLYAGESPCSWGCLGCGDCVDACQFEAIRIDPETLLPEVEEARCTACGLCAKACPRNVIEMRPKGRLSRRVYVACVSKDKGAVARKACAVSCIGCGKCVKACPFEAIVWENNLAYIDPAKCRLCRKCVDVCPQKSIVALNFPLRGGLENEPLEQKEPRIKN